MTNQNSNYISWKFGCCHVTKFSPLRWNVFSEFCLKKDWVSISLLPCGWNVLGSQTHWLRWEDVCWMLKDGKGNWMFGIVELSRATYTNSSMRKKCTFIWCEAPHFRISLLHHYHLILYLAFEAHTVYRSLYVFGILIAKLGGSRNR